MYSNMWSSDCFSRRSYGRRRGPQLQYRLWSRATKQNYRKCAVGRRHTQSVEGFEDIADDNKRRQMKADLIHRSMEAMLGPLQEASEDGVDMWCADGRLRRVYPMVAAYIADWPEQNLMSCTSEGSCPVCTTKRPGRGDHARPAPLRDRDETLRAIKAACQPRDVHHPRLAASAVPGYLQVPCRALVAVSGRREEARRSLRVDDFGCRFDAR